MTDRSGRVSREKGNNRTERAIVRLLQARGFAAERGRFGGDVSVPVLGIDRSVGVKCRGDGLVVKCDRGEPLVILPLRLAAEIAAVAERSRGLA